MKRMQSGIGVQPYRNKNSLVWEDDDGTISDGEETDEENENEETAEQEITEPEVGETNGEAAAETETQAPRTETQTVEVGGTSKRARNAPVWMKNFVSGEEEEEEEELGNFALYICNDDPIHFHDASREEKWKKAMEVEIQCIEKKQTWEFVDLPPNMKKIGVKWVYKTKLNEKGKVEKCKARLVAKGYSQTQGVDYTEVFVPVACWDTIRILLAVAAQRGWCVYQLDIKSAFLYGELKEEVYVDQPEGFIKVREEEKVYRLRKALYGSVALKVT